MSAALAGGAGARGPLNSISRHFIGIIAILEYMDMPNPSPLSGSAFLDEEGVVVKARLRARLLHLRGFEVAGEFGTSRAF